MEPLQLQHLLQAILIILVVGGVVSGQILAFKLKRLKERFLKNWDGISQNPFAKRIGTVSSILFQNKYAVLCDKAVNNLVFMQRTVVVILLLDLVALEAVHFFLR